MLVFYLIKMKFLAIKQKNKFYNVLASIPFETLLGNVKGSLQFDNNCLFDNN